MTTAGPWSVKGIDPKAREIAKDLARRSGMTLGEWLNHMIIEGEEDGGASDGSPYDRAWLDAPRTRTQAAAFSATDSLRARINRELGREPPPPVGARDVGLGHNSEAGELQRIGKLLAELSARIEGTEHRATLQISGIDQQVMGVLGRVENAEREQNAAAARFETAVDEVRGGQSKLNERLRRFDGDEDARMEAIKALEGALNKVAGQIYEGESRARASMAELREDVSSLARRVDRTEAVIPVEETTAAERRLEALAAELTRKVEEVRGETSAHLKQAQDGKFERLEGAIREIVSKVGESEKRSSEAVDRMGREVMRVAQTMSSRVQAVEGRSAAATEQMGSEMARIAEAMEGRMRQADAAQAESLEKLGGELARIAEKLADRIAASERRAAGAMTHMGDQLSGVTDSLNQRNDQAAADIAERIRASEERTAKLLAETRESLDRRLAQTQSIGAAFSEAEAPTPARPKLVPPAPSPPDPFSEEAFAPAPFGETPYAPGPAFDDPFAGPAPHGGFEDFPPEQAFQTDPAFAHPAAPAPAAPEVRSTRDMIASARAAARAASEGRRGRGADPFVDGSAAFEAASYDSRFTAGEFSAPEVEVAADNARTGVLGFGFPLPRKKKKEGPTLKTLLMASAVAATLSVTAVGAVGLAALDAKGGPKRDAPSAAPDPKAALAAIERSASDPMPSTPAADDTGSASGDRLAMALSAPAPAALPPTLKAGAAPPAPPTAAPAKLTASATPPIVPGPTGPAPRALFAAAVRQVEAGDPKGVEALKQSANLGYAPAEFYLAKLFETGGSGVKKDAGEARRWTDRAAQAGDSKAMHNLALYWFEGTGGPKDPAQAADWFKRAAERGVQDSQYNLARLYEQGFGVSKNPAEAYKWYLVAGAAGDAEAKTGADTVKRQLSPDAQAQAERAAQSFRAQIAASALRTASVE